MGFISKFVVSLYMMGLMIVPISLAQNSNKDFVATHNIYRSEVGVAPLVWNNTLAAYAKNYLKSKYESCEFEHSNGPYGENLAMGYGEFAGVDAVKMWADEKTHYDYASNSCKGGECLHYTQVVWRNTEQIGCAIVKCKKGFTFISCNYCPTGNYVGERPY